MAPKPKPKPNKQNPPQTKTNKEQQQEKNPISAFWPPSSNFHLVGSTQRKNGQKRGHRASLGGRSVVLKFFPWFHAQGSFLAWSGGTLQSADIAQGSTLPTAEHIWPGSVGSRLASISPQVLSRIPKLGHMEVLEEEWEGIETVVIRSLGVGLSFGYPTVPKRDREAHKRGS